MTGSVEKPIEVKFWPKVKKTEGCWIWMGSKSPDGYGVLRTLAGPKRAHRIAYELAKGPIPEGKQLDHLCRNRGCVNPSHLEIVSSAENTMRGYGPTAQNAKKMFCKRGHPLTGDNLRGGQKTRQCKTCHNIRQRQLRSLRRGPT